LAGARRRKRSSNNLLSHEVGEVLPGESIKDSVSKLLDENPLLTAKPLCKLLNLPWPQYQSYTNNLRSRWLSSPRNERGSKCSIHGWRGWCYLAPNISGGIRSHAVEVGWVETRARNRWLLWKDRLGRLQWFETGRVNLYVRKPANLGKAYQLVCDGFSFTSLITDMKVLESVLKSVRFKGAHFVFDTKERLPYLVIDLFGKSNGVVINGAYTNVNHCPCPCSTR